MRLKHIDTLVSDVYKVLGGEGDWTSEIKKFVSSGMEELIETRFINPEVRKLALSPSSLGEICQRKLWYKFNTEHKDNVSSGMIGTFFYGDLVELVLIGMIKASGHSIEGLQERVTIDTMTGSIDCIIDGMLVDIKSASGFGFTKFKKHNLKEDDPYGYISQLSSYLYGLQNDTRITNKNTAAFLVVNKERFELILDVYDLTEEVANKSKELEEAKALISSPTPPERPKWKFLDKEKEPYYSEDEEDGSNRKLGKTCSYCPYKFTCWNNELRVFQYSNERRYFTEVNKEPKVAEITNLH